MTALEASRLAIESWLLVHQAISVSPKRLGDPSLEAVLEAAEDLL